MFELSRVEEAGLYTESGLVPLRGVSISAEVIDVASKVVVVQRYRNDEKKPIEATYCFPLEEGSAVCGFEVRIGDRLIQGEVEEREKAFKKYDEAMAQGDGAFLLDQEMPNIFVASIGNLNPGQEATVSITYVAELSVSDDQIRLMIPTTVSPRYAPADADPIKIDVISPPTSLQVPYGLSLRVCIRNGAGITQVTSPSHKTKVRQTEKDWEVALSDSETRLDRDFILEMRLKEPRAPFVRVQQRESGDRGVMLRLYPEFDQKEGTTPSEVIFLLDCSGSMGGSSIAQATRAIELCLRTLSAGDKFNIIRFGSNFESLFTTSMDYTDESLEKAVKYVQKIDADLGGTEIYPAMKHILKEMPYSNEHKRELIVLTDGQVSNEEEVIRLAGKHRDRVRIFSFGIGNGASESLVRGIARATRGAAEFISPEERIEDKVLRQFARLATPAIVDLRIDWKGMKVKQAPAQIPPIFSGDSFAVYGLIEGGSDTDQVTLSGMLEGKEIVWSVPLSFEGNGELIPTLWARNHIRDLESGIELEGGSRQTHRKAASLKNTLVEIGKRFHLVSSETSFVAIETRSDSEKTTEQAVYRRVPIQLTKDWHGKRDLLQASVGAVLAYSLAPSLDMPSLRGSSSIYESRDPQISFQKTVESQSKELSETEEPWVYELLRMQEAAGCFDLTRALAKFVNRPFKILRNLASQIEGVEKGMQEKVLATALTVLVLERNGAEFKDQWDRADKKARKWLEDNANESRLFGKPVLEWLGEAFSDEGLNLPSDQYVTGPSLGS